MALTISSFPDLQQTNAPEFTVSTSLVEGSSYQNLRVRATLYVAGYNSGEPVAVIEQPKGLNDWDFYEVLSSYIGREDTAVGGSTLLVQPTLGSQLISSWSNYNNSYDTFSSTSNQITSVIDGTNGGEAISNAITMAKGELYVVQLGSDFSDTGTAPFWLALKSGGGGTTYHRNTYAGLDDTEGTMGERNNYYFLLTDDTYLGTYITLENNGPCAGDGTISAYKVTDYNNHPVVFFRVVFTEVYENATDVTTTGDVEEADTYMFVPVVTDPGETFNADFMFSSANTQKPLSRTINSGIKYTYGIGMELRVLFIHNLGISVQTVTSVGGGDTTGSVTTSIGWSMLVINDNTITGLTSSTTTMTVNLVEGVNEDWDNGEFTLECELLCNPNKKIITFTGDLGEEAIVFDGKETLVMQTEKTYYKKSDRTSRTLKSYRKAIHTLRLRYSNENINYLIHELMHTNLPVFMLDTDFTDNYREVGVITDNVVIKDGRDITENEIQLEYYE